MKITCKALKRYLALERHNFHILTIRFFFHPEKMVNQSLQSLSVSISTKTHFPKEKAVNMMYPPVVPFFVIPILYPLNILLFGAVPTGEGFVKWKVWCYFQSQSFDLNKSLAQVLLVVVCRSSFIVDHWSKTLSDEITNYGKRSINQKYFSKKLLTNKNVKISVSFFFSF